MTIYDFTDAMMEAHNALVKAKLNFSTVVEAESRKGTLTERHRGKWCADCARVSANSPVMVKGDAPVVTEDSAETVVLEQPEVVDITILSWQDLLKKARADGHNVNGMIRRDVERLYEVTA